MISKNTWIPGYLDTWTLGYQAHTRQVCFSCFLFLAAVSPKLALVSKFVLDSLRNLLALRVVLGYTSGIPQPPTGGYLSETRRKRMDGFSDAANFSSVIRRAIEFQASVYRYSSVGSLGRRAGHLGRMRVRCARWSTGDVWETSSVLAANACSWYRS